MALNLNAVNVTYFARLKRLVQRIGRSESDVELGHHSQDTEGGAEQTPPRMVSARPSRNR